MFYVPSTEGTMDDDFSLDCFIRYMPTHTPKQPVLKKQRDPPRVIHGEVTVSLLVRGVRSCPRTANTISA